ncbi:MAG: procyclic acidic repetitive family protein, partial [Muribaculaceae bacterium]|nr:procyclic acidic repetitive family protein [Muribaculaceae bacterium]
RFTDPKPADVPTAAPDAKPEAKSVPTPDKPKKKKPSAKPKPQTKPEPMPQPKFKPSVKPKPEPKPEVTPEPKPEVKPEPKPEVKPEPKPKEEKAKPEKKPKQEKLPKTEKKPKEEKPKPQPKPQPTPAPVPEPESQPTVAQGPAYTFPFYSVEFDVKDSVLPLTNKLKSPGDYAKQWRAFAASDVKNLIPELKRIADENSLNDYLTFEMIRSYVDSRYASAHPTARVALEQYLLANMGYDVRLAVDDDSTPLLLIPFRQYVYARPYLVLNNQTYYVFQPRGERLDPNTGISTYKLPSDADLGRPLDLLLTELTIPQKMKDFHLSYGGIELNGQVNENIFPIVYNYPQMKIADFANSTISPKLREDLVAQLKSQLGGMPQHEAVDKLLHFTQKAFEYATDGDFHGFEKPYFIEEILFYPKCDCEDRSIFYTYMLWNALGVESHLLAYPGHESASVHLSEPIKGTGYDYEGKHFYISDPTYIGSRSGMCMPVYEYTKPEIDLIYQ